MFGYASTWMVSIAVTRMGGSLDAIGRLPNLRPAFLRRRPCNEGSTIPCWLPDASRHGKPCDHPARSIVDRAVRGQSRIAMSVIALGDASRHGKPCDHPARSPTSRFAIDLLQRGRLLFLGPTSQWTHSAFGRPQWKD